MKTLAEHAAELRKVAGAHFNYTIGGPPVADAVVDMHDGLCDAADALEQAAEVLRKCAEYPHCPLGCSRGATGTHDADCTLAALIGAK